jgi:hypothetical protein
MVTRLFAGAAALIVSTAALAQSPFIPNSVKYRDAGMKPATGRSGSASIEAYVLIGKDNTAALEVSANGALEKVQLKRIAADVTTNFHPGGANSVFTTPVEGVALREAVQVQANVSGVDGARMDVVTAATTVARRPDLAVESITAAPHAVAGGPIRIAALVRELNGDIGARASCVLSANGVDVDRADDIWIDAGGSVNCFFAPSFTNVGPQSFTVRVDDVRPGDDDPSNNAAAGSMTLYESASDFTAAWVNVMQSEYTNTDVTRAWWGVEHETETGFEGESMIEVYLANRNAGVANLNVSTRESTDGQLIFEANDVPLTVTPAEYPTAPTCAFARENDQIWEMCDIPFAFRQPRSFWLYVVRLSGWITYHSTGWNTTMPTNTPPGYYTWNRTAEGGWGAQTRLGSTYEWQLTISNGTELWETAGVTPVTSSTRNQTSTRCSNTTQGQVCIDRTRSAVDKRANASSYN